MKVEHTAATAPRWCCTATRWRRPATEAHRLADEQELVFVHPYDDPRIIAGQGTVALEMLEDAPTSTCSSCRSAAAA